MNYYQDDNYSWVLDWQREQAEKYQSKKLNRKGGDKHNNEQIAEKRTR